MSRGFVTIATGDEHFYHIASNLLLSYRLRCDDPMPFAIICDRENDFTKGFDVVVPLQEPTCSYLDKLALPNLAPFDETIFIDADSLAYADLNDFWEVFRDASDFSAFGADFPTSYPHAWFKIEDVGDFASEISSIPDFIGGVYFVRKSEELEKFARTCQLILSRYDRFVFRQFDNPADEPIFALAMAVHGFRTAGGRSLPVCFYPHAEHFEADMLSGRVRYDSIYSRDKGIVEGAYLVHWGSGNTGRPCYLFQERLLSALANGESPGRCCTALMKASVSAKWAMRKIQSRFGML